MREATTTTTVGSKPGNIRTLRIFLAGATGVLGRATIPLLLEAGHDVTAVGRSAAKRGMLARLGVRPADTDLFDPASVRRSLAGVEAIINLSTAVPPGLRSLVPLAWRPMDRVRREISANLVDAALAGGTVERLVQESFAPIYADGGNSWLGEEAPIRAAHYNHSILDAEANLERFSRGGGSGVVLRFAYLYGPQDANTDMLIESVKKGWYPLFGSPEGFSSWLHHADAASAIDAALSLAAGVYNVVEDEPMPRRRLAEGLARELDVRPPRFLPPWTGRLGSVAETLARSLRISNRKLKEASSWRPNYPTMLAGLSEIVQAGRPTAGVRP